MVETKFVSPAAPPTPHQREVLTILMEECAEVIQRASKALRFGPLEIQPGQSFDNSARLGFEVGDVMELIDLAVSIGLIPYGTIEEGRRRKREKLAKYMQTEMDE